MLLSRPTGPFAREDESIERIEEGGKRRASTCSAEGGIGKTEAEIVQSVMARSNGEHPSRGTEALRRCHGRRGDEGTHPPFDACLTLGCYYVAVSRGGTSRSKLGDGERRPWRERGSSHQHVWGALSMWMHLLRAVCVSLAGGSPAAPDTLVLTTGSPTGSYQALGQVIAGIIEREIPAAGASVSGTLERECEPNTEGS